MTASNEIKNEQKLSSSGATSGASSSDKSDSRPSTKSLPKDGHVMAAILRDMGVQDYEPRVIHQLLEFSYRYATDILEDAKTVSAHAKKKSIDMDDVKLAVQMYTEQNVTTPPSRDFLLEMARTRNATPLPIPKPTCGLRIPPERHCLTALNYRVRPRPRVKKQQQHSIETQLEK